MFWCWNRGQSSKPRTDPIGQLCIGVNENTWLMHKKVSDGVDAGKDVMLRSCILGVMVLLMITDLEVQKDLLSNVNLERWFGRVEALSPEILITLVECGSRYVVCLCKRGLWNRSPM
ncbi:hypothetical protein V6N13_009382 [Hibiscus sabdariffa]